MSLPTLQKDSSHQQDSSSSQLPTKSSFSSPLIRLLESDEKPAAIKTRDDLLPYFYVWPPLKKAWYHDTAMEKAKAVTPDRIPVSPDSTSGPGKTPPPLEKFRGVTATKSGSAELSHRQKAGRPQGKFNNTLPEDERVRLTPEQALRKLMMPGLAAAQVTVPRAGVSPPTATLSGFRIAYNNVDAVITCAHFIDWPKKQEDFDDVARHYNVTLGSQGGVATQAALTDALGVEPGTYIIQMSVPMHSQFALQLIAVHRPWDLAVFRIVEKPEDDDPEHAIKPPQLAFFRDQDLGALGRPDLLWSVGYNLNCSEEGLQSNWKMYWSRQSLEVQAKIHREYGLNAITKPSTDFLKPNQRTVCFGTLDEASLRRINRADYRVDINLSAWYGRSGSMVCYCPTGEKSVRICGLVAGGTPDSDQNYMVLFTDEMKDWFANALGPHDESDFHQRFVMSLGP
ncbi:uncharacterized protein Z520_12240 [Fonsecaea multimorphosa CBS 102226]|uniref:Peptidase S1 domain-containing protein n=1 Tax=Fonsecaea multimorphosa CBS 102226 TaxID=1442371 RepID=A0A0D2GR76_9EURO|nr:uncharacterized protein Z520_12240 [Fonsecaea multimorphosa CBS 102226]KIX92025.1 hypothetical protein Z520_12240 [Fonsecaea multimorphosa CBS 102226]OAL17394.1 hypothetical protein AYO22_11674 [Fonsecaea multimorphosa]